MTGEADSNTLDFLAPLPMDKAIRRLQNKHESFAFFAWEWTMRTTVKIKVQDNSTVKFSMERIGKNDLFNLFPMAHAKGYLRRYDANHTMVVATAKVPARTVVLTIVLYLFMLGSFILPIATGAEAVPITGVAFMLLLVTGAIAWTAYWATSQRAILASEIQEALAYQPENHLR